MTQSDQWHPSDIEKAAGETDATAPIKRRPRLPSETEAAGDAPQQAAPKPQTAPEQQARPVSSGVMTLDRDSSYREPGQQKVDAPPPADVLERLRENAERCIRGYDSWRSGNDGEGELTDGLHELRKVLARIEIELAASHADESAQRPIPIPLHRAHKHGGDSRR